MTTVTIAVDGLTYAYSAKSPSHVLSDINLRLPEGSRTVLVGANGGLYHLDLRLDPNSPPFF